MTPEEYAKLDATALSALVRKGEASPAEALEAAIALIESRDTEINAVVIRWFEEALEAAKTSSVEGALAGVPFLLKNLMGAAKGTPLTAGAKSLQRYVCDRDSHAVAKLRAAGAAFMGRTNCPEFGLQAICEPELYGATRNPRNTDYSTGGSSGGAAAAVAAGYVPIAHANDGGGSIRIPASCCGVIGLKPSRGRISLGPHYGELLGGLVVEGAVTRTVRDAALALDVMSGAAPGDPYVIEKPTLPYVEAIKRPQDRLRIAWSVDSPLGNEVHPECKRAAEIAARKCEELGHSVEEAAPPVDAEEFRTMFMTLWLSSVSKSVESICRGAGVPPNAALFEPLTWALYEKARGIPAWQYLLALDTMHRFGRVFGAFFEKYDAWLTPTLAWPPPRIGELKPDPANPLPAAEKAFDFNPFCLIANATGQPAISLPVHQTESSLQIGVQFQAAFGGEALLLQVAAGLENEFISSQ